MLRRRLLAAAPDAQLPLVPSDRAKYVLGVAVSVVNGAIRVGDHQASQCRAAEKTVAGLRRALEDCEKQLDMAGMWRERNQIRTALAASPAEHERKLKAEGAAEKLNEMADGGLNWDAVTLRREAESVLLEAANGR